MQLAAFILIATFFAGYFLTDLMISSRLKVLLDFSLLSYQIFEFCFILFFVIPFFTNQENIKTISLFLTKPISRATFLAGVYTGFLTILFSAALIFSFTYIFAIWAISGFFMPHLLIGFGVIFIESVFLTSIALAASLLFPHLIAYGILFAAYIISYTSHSWLMLVIKKANTIGALLAYILYWLLPDLSLLDIKSHIIYQLPFSFTNLLLSVAYTTTISSLFFILSLLIFGCKRV